MKRGTIIIPESPLDAELSRLTSLKRRARTMLEELEKAAGHSDSEATGKWRHNPLDWMNRKK